VADDTGRHALRGLPWPTLALRPSEGKSRLVGLIRLPLDKRVPFFLTRDNAKVESEQVLGIGLTASDF